MKVFEKIKHSMQKWCCWHPIYLLKSGANKACGISLSSVLVASIYYITLYNDYTQYRRGLKAVLIREGGFIELLYKPYSICMIVSEQFLENASSVW